jgi:4'-phosphopantetheinyl transferase
VLSRTALERTVHVWLVDPDRASGERCRQLHALLSPDERERMERLYLARDRTTFVVAHGVLRALIGRYSFWPPADVVFETGPFGRPELPGGQLRFNISHTRGLVALAFALDAPCGVDVEEIRDDVDVELLIPTVCSDEECAALPVSGAARRTEFFRLWSAKEAVLKGAGAGLAEGLTSLILRARAHGAFDVVDRLERVPDQSQWHVRAALYRGTHAVAIAFHAPAGREVGLALHELDLSGRG